PKDVPFDDPRVHDSDEILEMRNLPRSMAVIGAGVIGCEYTTIFAALGIKTSLIDGRDRLLGFLDAEVAEQLKTQMGLLGVDLRLKESVSRYLPEPDCIRLELKSGASIMVDQLLVAAGRVANVRTLGIDRAGLAVNERGLISVDLGGEIKLVFRYPDKLLFGVHLIGVNAAELIHIGVIALQTECTIDMFVNTVFNYPSLSDVYKYAAYDGLGAVQRRAADPPTSRH